MGDFELACDGGALEGVGGFVDPLVGPFLLLGGGGCFGIGDDGIGGGAAVYVEVPGTEDF